MLRFIKNYAYAYYTTRSKLFFPRFTAQNPHLVYLCVNRETQVVIEGFPRCGNTFAVVAFQKAQDRQVKIAHHLHVAAQVFRAARLNIPTLVLIREPLDAISSLIVRHPEREIDRSLIEYNMFYRSILPLREKYAVSDFKETVSDLGLATARLNELFGTTFKNFEHTSENLDAVFNSIENLNKQFENGNVLQLARPAKEKEIPKEEVKDMLMSRRYKSLLERASEVYLRLLNDLWRN